MGLSLETSVPVLTVFLQGLLSFFSPCVLPLVPLYVSYLAGGARDVDSDGNIRYPRGRVLVNTLFFVVGISFTFFLLGFGFTALGSFFRSNQTWFARISGIIMILFGLYQFGVFGRSGALEREHRLPFRLDRWAMNPLVALVLGFTFSFAWTPCVGPTLGSVLLMASSAGQRRPRLPADCGIHPRLCDPLPGRGTVYRGGAGLFQAPPEGGTLHCEGGRGPAGAYGHHDTDWLHERHYQLPVQRGGQRSGRNCPRLRQAELRTPHQRGACPPDRRRARRPAGGR